MFKGTPGPWKAVRDRVTAGGRYNVCPYVTAGGSSKGMIDERQVAEANASLIAAAPELLEALSAIVSSLSENDEEGMVEHAEQMIAARAAIAKATGADAKEPT